MNRIAKCVVHISIGRDKWRRDGPCRRWRPSHAATYNEMHRVNVCCRLVYIHHDHCCCSSLTCRIHYVTCFFFSFFLSFFFPPFLVLLLTFGHVDIVFHGLLMRHWPCSLCHETDRDHSSPSRRRDGILKPSQAKPHQAKPHQASCGRQRLSLLS